MSINPAQNSATGRAPPPAGSQPFASDRPRKIRRSFQEPPPARSRRIYVHVVQLVQTAKLFIPLRRTIQHLHVRSTARKGCGRHRFRLGCGLQKPSEALASPPPGSLEPVRVRRSSGTGHGDRPLRWTRLGQDTHAYTASVAVSFPGPPDAPFSSHFG